MNFEIFIFLFFFFFDYLLENRFNLTFEKLLELLNVFKSILHSFPAATWSWHNLIILIVQNNIIETELQINIWSPDVLVDFCNKTIESHKNCWPFGFINIFVLFLLTQLEQQLLYSCLQLFYSLLLLFFVWLYFCLQLLYLVISRVFFFFLS